MKRNPYKILGVSRNAGDEEIRSAYRRLAKQEHPDAGDRGGDECFRELNDAYETIRTDDRRRVYDRSRGYDRRDRYDWSDRRPAGAPRPRTGPSRRSAFGPEFERLFSRLFGFRNEDFFTFETPRSQDNHFRAEAHLYPGQAASGVSLDLEFPDGRRRVDVPSGVDDGTKLTYRETDQGGKTVTLDLLIRVHRAGGIKR